MFGSCDVFIVLAVGHLKAYEWNVISSNAVSKFFLKYVYKRLISWNVSIGEEVKWWVGKKK